MQTRPAAPRPTASWATNPAIIVRTVGALGRLTPVERRRCPARRCSRPAGRLVPASAVRRLEEGHLLDFRGFLASTAPNACMSSFVGGGAGLALTAPAKQQVTQGSRAAVTFWPGPPGSVRLSTRGHRCWGTPLQPGTTRLGSVGQRDHAPWWCTVDAVTDTTFGAERGLALDLRVCPALRCHQLNAGAGDKLTSGRLAFRPAAVRVAAAGTRYLITVAATDSTGPGRPGVRDLPGGDDPVTHPTGSPDQHRT